MAIGITFFAHGYPKLFLAGPAGFVGSLGFPVPLFIAWVVTIVEFFGGIAMTLGVLMRYAGALLLFAIAVVLMLVGPVGHGQLAIDHAIRSRRSQLAPS